MQIIVIPPNSTEPIRFEINDHVTMRIFQSVDPQVMSGAYRSVISRGLPMIGLGLH